MAEVAPPPGAGGDGLSRSDLLLLNRAMRLNWAVPDHVLREAVQQLANLIDPEYLHPPNNRPASPRMRLAALKLLPAFLDKQLKQQAVDVRLFQVLGGRDVAAAPAERDADMLRQALALLRGPERPEDQGAAGDGRGVGGEAPGDGRLPGP